MPTEILRPLAVGEFGHEIVGGTLGWDVVDEEVADEDTSYLWTDSVDYTSFTFDATVIPADTSVTSFSIFVRAKVTANASGGDVIKVFGTFDQVEYTQADYTGGGQTVPVSTSYTNYEFINLPRPGGGSWTAADFQPGGIEIGVESQEDASDETRFTQMWVVLNYLSAGLFMAGRSM